MADQAEFPDVSRTKTYESIRGESAYPNVTRTHTSGSHVRRSSLSRSNTHLSHKETRRDPDLDVEGLPYRTYTANANLEEYTSEKPDGEIDGGVTPDGQRRYKLVTFKPNDPENPKNWSKAFKWYVTMVVAVTCFVVAFCSSVITADLVGVQETFGVSEEVSLLTITVFVVGFGVGKCS
jgi:hypothetical protein